MTDIGRLKELEAKATPAPWNRLESHTRLFVGPDKKTVVITGGWTVAWKTDDGAGDADFIAELRNAAPSLLSEIETLRAALAEASRQLAIAYTILPTDTPRSAEARCIIQGVRVDIDSAASHKENADG